MNSKGYLSLAGILVGLAFALSNFGCGGGRTTLTGNCGLNANCVGKAALMFWTSRGIRAQLWP